MFFENKNFVSAVSFPLGNDEDVTDYETIK